MADVRVQGWGELHDRLYEGAWDPGLGRFRSHAAFRGSGDAADDLSTSLVRLGGDAGGIEGHLLRNFRKYACGYEKSGDGTWSWLALGQHHGLPTRLLDWTFSPLVALHFCTADVARWHRDGAIWLVDFHELARELPSTLTRELALERADVFTVEMLDRVAPTLGRFDALARQPFPLFFEPPSFDERIVNQYALFSAMSDPAASLDRWLEPRPHLWRRIVVPAALKPEIRDKLDQANVNERVLLPGLDGLSRWLARHYAPRADATTDRAIDRRRFERSERTAELGDEPVVPG